MRCNSEKRRAFSLIDLLLAVALLGAVLAFLIEAGNYLSVPRYMLSHFTISASGNRYAAIDAHGSSGDIHVWQRMPRLQVMNIPGPTYDYLEDPVALSSHGKKLAFFDHPPSGDYLSLWEVDTHNQVFRSNLSVVLMEFSPDEGALACLLKDGTIDVLDSRNGSLLYKLNANAPAACTAMGWSPDGQLIAGRIEDEIIFWSTSTGTQTLSAITVDHSPDYGTRLKFSPDGKCLVVGTYYFPNCGGRINKSRIDLYDVLTKQCLGSWEQPAEIFYRLAFLQQGKVLAFTTDELHFLAVPSLDEVKVCPAIMYANGPWALGEEQVGLGLADSVYGVNLDGSVDEDALGIHHARSRHGKKSVIFFAAIIFINLGWQIARVFRTRQTRIRINAN